MSNWMNMISISALGGEIFWNTRVKLAETLTLECQYPLGTLVQMEWFKINAMEKESIAIFHPNFGSVIREPYADRVYFLKSTSGPNDIMLAFYNASEADIGSYSCLLEIFPYGSWEKVIQVVPSGKCKFHFPFYPSAVFDFIKLKLKQWSALSYFVMLSNSISRFYEYYFKRIKLN